MERFQTLDPACDSKAQRELFYNFVLHRTLLLREQESLAQRALMANPTLEY
jgi:hypothetical protein